MSDDVAPQEALRRVENALRQWDHHRQNQQRILRLLTTIADTLEATRPTSPEEGGMAAPSTAPSSFSPGGDSHGGAAQHQSIAAALGAVRETMAASRRNVCAALTRLSCRVRAAGDGVRGLSGAARATAAAVEDRRAARGGRGALRAAAVMTLATVAQRSAAPAAPRVPSAAVALRERWERKERQHTAALRATATAHDSTAHTACRLLRSALLETIASQRWFPSPRTHQMRRGCRAAWYREMNEADAQRRAAQRAKWERHTKTAGLVTESEWS